MNRTMKWDSNLNIGIELIDSQHKIMFDLSKDLHNAINMGANRQVVDTLFGVIMSYSFNHFETEEKLLEKEAGFLQHCYQHYQLLRELHGYIHDYRNNRKVEKEPGEFLKDWIVRHIRDYDLPVMAEKKDELDLSLEVDPLETFDEGEIDKRKYARVRYDRVLDEDIYANLYNANSLKNGTASVVDMSSGGLKIYSVMDMDIGDLIMISCRIGKNFKLKEKVVVKHSNDNFHGVEFVAPDGDTVRFLAQLCGAVHRYT